MQSESCPIIPTQIHPMKFEFHDLHHNTLLPGIFVDNIQQRPRYKCTKILRAMAHVILKIELLMDNRFMFLS